MRRGMFIKHKDFMDVCLEVMSYHNYGHGIEVKARWWNMGYVNSYSLFGLDHYKRINFRKKLSDVKRPGQHFLGNWLVMNNTGKECKRYETWE